MPIKNLMFQGVSGWFLFVLVLSFTEQFVCMTNLLQYCLASPNLKKDWRHNYGLLKSIREHPLIWEPVFVSGSAPSLTATAFLNELLVDFILSDVKKQKEIDVFYHFTNYIQSLNTDGLQTTLKWTVGSSTIPPLGLPKKLSIQFLHGCVVGCRCRPITSTCALKITLPVHLDNADDMKSIMGSAIADSEGFGLV